MPARRAKAKAKAGDACDDLECECCVVRRTGRACTDLDELRLRFGHAIQIVLDAGARRGFLYTYGAEPEFLIKDVPCERVPVAQAMLNGLVGRTRSGHPVLHGHTVLCEELLFVAVELRGDALHDALATHCLACRRDANVVLLQPAVQTESLEMWARAPRGECCEARASPE